jgi:hypothetical protein
MYIFMLFSVTLLIFSCSTLKYDEIHNRKTYNNIQDAVSDSIKEIVNLFPSNTRIAVVSLNTESVKLSEFVLEELVGDLSDIGFQVPERTYLEYVREELNLQLSGEINDEMALSIGKFIGAEYILVGDIVDVGKYYR